MITGKLRWACRRGMLELDLLFNHFLDQRYLQSSWQEQQAFHALLQYADADLILWLLGHSSPINPELKPIIQLIRYARHSI